MNLACRIVRKGVKQHAYGLPLLAAFEVTPAPFSNAR